MMKKSFLYFSLVLIGFMSFLGGHVVAEESLYNRIGGYDVIAKFSAGLIDGFYEHPKFKRFTEGGAPEDVVKRDKQLTAEYMCQITGGPCFYIGKDMLSVHEDLNITGDEWAALMEIAASQTTDWKIKSSDKKEFLTLFDNIKELMEIHKP